MLFFFLLQSNLQEEHLGVDDDWTAFRVNPRADSFVEPHGFYACVMQTLPINELIRKVELRLFTIDL